MNFKVKNGKIIHQIRIDDLCPYCKTGSIIIRSGKYGNFFACSYFPSCSFTQNYKYTEAKNILDELADERLSKY